MRVLMSAYACVPGEGSEAGAGWAMVRAAARRYDVVLLTLDATADAVRAGLAAHPDLRPVRVVGLPVPAHVRRRGGFYAEYAAFQRAVARAARHLHADEPFDVVHHVTYGSDWLPVGVATLAGAVPFVWGPVGGTAPSALGFWRSLGVRGTAYEVARLLGRDPIARARARRLGPVTAVAVAVNDDAARPLRARFRTVLVEPHSVAEVDGRRPAPPTAAAAPTAVYAGRLIAWKGVALAIRALAEPEAAEWRLRVIGAGWDGARLERLARRLGVADRVVFLGPRPHDEVLAEIARADAFVFPSLHDAAPFALAEALSLGVPAITVGRAGGAFLPRASAGSPALVLAGGERRVIRGIARGLASRPPRGPGTDRWSPERFEALVSDWYTRAVSGGTP